MFEYAARLSVGAFGPGDGALFIRRMIVVSSHPTNPVSVGPTNSVELTFELRAINIQEDASIHYMIEGETSYLADGTVLEGDLTFTPNSPTAQFKVTVKPMSVNGIDRVFTVTFSNASGAQFVGDTTITTVLKPNSVGSGLVCNADSFVVVKGTTDNVLDVLANDRASAPISIAGLVSGAPSGLRVANDSKTLLYSPGNTVRTPFTTRYNAVVPTTLETGQGVITLEVEDVFAFTAATYSARYGRVTNLDVLSTATPEGKVFVSAVTQPADGSVSIADGGASVDIDVPTDANTPLTSVTFNVTVKHRRTNATIVRTITVNFTSATQGLLGNGPISGLPWFYGGTHNDYNGNPKLSTITGRNPDIVQTFGDRGKGDNTDAATQWKAIRGGDITGTALQGCLLGIKWANNGAITNNPNLSVIVTYDQWPFFYSKDTDANRQQRFEDTADGTFATGVGTSDEVYEAFGAKLKRIAELYGWPNVIVRMNHECNGTDSYPHYVRTVNQADPFIQATRRCIEKIKANATSTQYNLYFCQNFGRNSNGGSIGPDLWVGKNWCQILELDFYNRNPPVPITDTASMNRYLNNTRGTSRIYKKRDGVTALPGCNGPRTWADFARQIGVGFAVGEWGNMMDTNHHPGAQGDVPAFIEGVWNFYNEIQDVLWYETYFTQSDSDLGQMPLSRAKYAELWGR